MLDEVMNRPPEALDAEYLTGTRVLVTGGGGSIGSQLCKVIAARAPTMLTVVDQSEHALYCIGEELAKMKIQMCGGRYQLMLGDVRHESVIREVFRKARPHYVFHAAALKHVPMLEMKHNLIEAVRTNVSGSYRVARMAAAYDVKGMVNVSTDKAVYPSSIMGTTKRAAEIAMLRVSERYGLKVVTARFGNVMGSNGSVIPKFREQIKRLGPVTVTDKRMTRFFMSIQDAVALMINALGAKPRTDLCFLDPGPPVRLVDLANWLIDQEFPPGMEHRPKIQIQFTGMRPGEKLYEALRYDDEFVSSRSGRVIWLLHRDGIEDRMPSVMELMDAADEREGQIVRHLLRQAVREYTGAFDA